MMFPLVQDLAAEGLPVNLCCRVLGFSPQAFYKWRAQPCSDRDLDDAYVTNALVDAHSEDPEFGYRFLTDELEAAGHRLGERRVWRLCRDQRLWSTTTKKGRRHGKGRPGPAVHDDLVQRVFSADAPDRVWLTDITEHPTGEGKLYCCAIKDVFSNRIVGYSIDDRMTAQLAVAALRSAVARRRPSGTVVVHSDRGSQGGINWSSQHPEMEVADGATTADGGQGAPPGDALTRAADPGASCGARVLASDRSRQEHRGRCRRDRGVGPRRVSLVSPRWRHDAVAPCRTDRPVSVVR